MMPDDTCPNCFGGILREDEITLELVCDECGFVSEDESDIDMDYPYDDPFDR